ncbi:ornithine cyclodeaminase [Paludibacterium yongneupense]|uniref:ornithine cyclodeaminase n=1 Tax=Paludibacterium yongneupense TaxID=400061 RepID=UPI0004150A40|nr:ornithine cyclodeaminase [Paludibacterium yongneupense]
MTRYIDTIDLQRLVKTIGAEVFIAQLARYIEADFRRWPDFDTCPRIAHHSDEGVIELMPISDGHYYGFKYVNGHPRNTRFDMLTVMAFGALARVDSGLPVLLSELTLTTALRTAATSALVAQVLARPDAKIMALIGNGAQSEFQLLAFHTLLNIDTFHLYDTDPAATDKLLSNLGGHPGLHLIRAASAREATEGADIITTVTADKNHATILTPDMIRPGMHVNAVGGDCPGKTELHPDILGMATVFVEFEAQTRIEGELQQMPADFAVTELWEVLAGVRPGRISADEITVFDSVGFALEDFSALRYVLDQSERYGIGNAIDLVPAPSDPKNLFQLLA